VWPLGNAGEGLLCDLFGPIPKLNVVGSNPSGAMVLLGESGHHLAPMRTELGLLLVLSLGCHSAAENADGGYASAGDALADVGPSPDSLAEVGPSSADSHGPDGPRLDLIDVYARAAAIVGSCLGEDGVSRFAARFWDPLPPQIFWGQFRRQAQCLATAGGGCAALRTCLGFDHVHGGPPCPDTGTLATCDGTRATVCGPDGDGGTIRNSWDCATLGLTCDPVALCTAHPSTMCSMDAVGLGCTSDGRATVCADHATLESGVCADLGLSCQAGRCTGDGAACAGGAPGPVGQVYLDGLACAGTQLKACVGGHEQSFDCARQGPDFGCQNVGGRFFCGLGAECVPSESGEGALPDSCDGNAIVFCSAGRIARVDCAALGFTSCRPGKGVPTRCDVPPAAP
jgi:hypothetical protein